MKRTLIHSDQAAIVAALRLAAHTYTNDAASVSQGPPSLGEQFRKQAKDAERLADTIENAEYVDVETLTAEEELGGAR